MSDGLPLPTPFSAQWLGGKHSMIVSALQDTMVYDEELEKWMPMQGPQFDSPAIFSNNERASAIMLRATYDFVERLLSRNERASAPAPAP